MTNGIKTGDPCRFDEGRSEGSRVRQTPEEDRRTYRPKRCGNNNKDEDTSLKTLNGENNTVNLTGIMVVIYICEKAIIIQVLS